MKYMPEGPFHGLKIQHYKTLYIDPPTKFVAGGKGRKPPYPTMKHEEMLALPVAALAADDCALFFWTSGPFVEMHLECMARWGFTFKTYAFVWVKTWPREAGRLFVDWQEQLDHSAAAGTGHWTQANAEIVLLGTRGKPARISTGVPQVVFHHRMEHSRKPEEIADRIERLVDGPRAELFARRSRPGWDTAGNQRTKFDPIPMTAGE